MMPEIDDPALAEIADLCVKARQALGSGGSSMLQLLLDMVLLELSRQLAAAEAEKGKNVSVSICNEPAEPQH